jgi:5'-3' exonuclease
VNLHLVDATYELFRNFYGHPPLAAPDGTEVGAVHGLLGTLLKLLRDPQVTHVACATDHVVTSFRNALWPGYKTGEGIDPALLAQFPLAEEGLRALGLTVWPMVEHEADDALATAAARWGDAVEQVVICTPDKDLAQCVRGARVVLWDRRRELRYDEAGVREKWGVPPAAIPDLLALVGDDADGLVGVPGWGQKSAAAALVRWGSLEAIPLDPAAWQGVAIRGPARLAGALAEHRERTLLMKQLATLRRDSPLPERLSDLEWRGAPREELQAFCARLGFARLAERPHRWAQ